MAMMMESKSNREESPPPPPYDGDGGIEMVNLDVIRSPPLFHDEILAQIRREQNDLKEVYRLDYLNLMAKYVDTLAFVNPKDVRRRDCLAVGAIIRLEEGRLYQKYRRRAAAINYKYNGRLLPDELFEHTLEWTNRLDEMGFRECVWRQPHYEQGSPSAAIALGLLVATFFGTVMTLKVYVDYDLLNTMGGSDKDVAAAVSIVLVISCLATFFTANVVFILARPPSEMVPPRKWKTTPRYPFVAFLAVYLVFWTVVLAAQGVRVSRRNHQDDGQRPAVKVLLPTVALIVGPLLSIIPSFLWSDGGILYRMRNSLPSYETVYGRINGNSVMV